MIGFIEKKERISWDLTCEEWELKAYGRRESMPGKANAAMISRLQSSYVGICMIYYRFEMKKRFNMLMFHQKVNPRIIYWWKVINYQLI